MARMRQRPPGLAVHSHVHHPGSAALDLAPGAAQEPQAAAGAASHPRSLRGHTGRPRAAQPSCLIYLLFSLFNSVISLSLQRNT